MGLECGETLVATQYAHYAIEFAKLSIGACSDVGYEHKDGHKSLNVPVLGDIDITLYSKA